MIAVFRHTLRDLRGQVLGWGLVLALMGWMIVSVYDSIAAQQDNLVKLLSGYPKELMAFFGAADAAFSMFTPEGFLSFEFFSLMPVVLGIFAVLTGSGLLASDEESGKLDLILAHPVSRTALSVGRLLAAVVATMSLITILWLGFLVAMSWSTLSIAPLELWLPFLSLLAVLVLFTTLALLLSMVLPSRGVAAGIAGLLLVASYFVTSLARINENLQRIAQFSPLNYYQTEQAFHDFNLRWFAGLVGVAAFFAVVAWWRFQRRDIRVGGEGGWRLPKVALPRTRIETQRLEPS
jgi:ABC-2 type transport system permease protein